jgi:hypothetical protein
MSLLMRRLVQTRGAFVSISAALTALLMALLPGNAAAQQQLSGRTVAGHPIEEFLSTGGLALLHGRQLTTPSPGDPDAAFPEISAPTPGVNTFVNDPCLDPWNKDPFPFNFFDTVQSETEIAVLNDGSPPDHVKMVAGYNDSFGFDDNREGLSGVSYSTDGGEHWIDAGGLPPRFPLGPDLLAGDPVVAVRHRSKIFYYASIYRNADFAFTLSVSRGKFKTTPLTRIESRPTTRCLEEPSLSRVPNVPLDQTERPVWTPPVQAVEATPFSFDLLDKPWLYVDQKTGKLYLTYSRFSFDVSLEMVVSDDGGRTWSLPSIILPGVFNVLPQATQLITTPSGRLVVTWVNRVFDPFTGIEQAQQIMAAFSDDDGFSWSLPIPVSDVNPQGEPPGYNRGRNQILNAPYIAVDKGADDGDFTPAERTRPGFGNVYIGYFNGRTPLPNIGFESAGDIRLSRSTDDGLTWGPPAVVSTDATRTSHVFPSVQVDAFGRVYVSWIDRRRDAPRNLLTDAWAAVSSNRGLTFGPNVRQTDVATSWFTRADAAPNFGDYNSSELVNFLDFVMVWADGRFRPPGRASFVGIATRATPDVIFSKAKGLLPAPPPPPPPPPPLPPPPPAPATGSGF